MDKKQDFHESPLEMPLSCKSMMEKMERELKNEESEEKSHSNSKKKKKK